MGTNGTKNASVTPNVYVFNVAENSGTWDGTCYTDKYYTAASPSVPTPDGDFAGWYTASSGGSAVTPGSLGAPSGITTYYGQFSSVTNYNVAITSPSNGTITVAWNDGIAHSFTSGNQDIAQNTSLTITATPSVGYNLTSLTITPSGESAASHASGSTYTLTKDITVAATFASDECEITIANPTPAGYGTISVSDGVNSYTVGQTYTFNRQNDNGKVLTVTATPETERVFSSWVGGLTQTGTNPYTATYTIGASTPNTLTIGATFDVKKYTLNATSSHGTVNLTAAGYDNAANTGAYAKNVTVTMTPVADDFYAFARWSDGNTDNPRTVTITDNLVLSAVFEVHPQSDPASVNVYQVGTNAGRKEIVYDLSPTTDVNNSSITYTPVDMGYGVAWADRNIGATSATNAGGYFYYGGTTAKYPGTAGSSSVYYSGIGSLSSGDNLPLAADAAYQLMGGNTWRIPTSTEWNQLLNNGAYDNTTLSANFTAAQASRTGNGTITSKTDPSKSITLPAVGLIRDQTYTQMSTYMCYWSSTLSVTSSNGGAIPYHVYLYNGKTLASGSGNALAWHSLPIRAIYSPRFNQNTLTIRTINGGTTYTYIYICEYGQEVTVTANPNTGSNYVFNEWSEDHNTNATRTFTVTSDMTYTATFTQATTYSITFVDEDGSTVLDGPKDVVEGVVPTYEGSAPTKAATAQYTYSFNGWSPALYAADKNQTYTATYSGTLNQYTILWKSEDGSETLETDADQNYGTTTAFNGSTPTKAATAQYTYTFDGWATSAGGEKVYNNGETPTVGGAATYYAHFTQTLNQYTILWKSEDGSETLETDADQNYGTATAFNGSTPTKEATAQYTYTFDGWATSAGGEKVYNIGGTPAVGGAATYYAHFSASTNTYTVTIVSSNAEYGTVDVASVANVPYGTTITTSTNTINVNGTTVTATPASATAKYTYTFDGWTNGTATVTDNLTVTANFSRSDNVVILNLLDDQDNGYYDDIRAYDGSLANVTYSRTFEAGRWSTLTLPFAVTTNLERTNKLWGCVYEFKRAEGTAEECEGCGLTLYFSRATSMEAGKCYIVNPNAALVERSKKGAFVFGGVEMDLSADVVDDLTETDAYDGLNYYGSGDIVLVGTLRNGILKSSTPKEYMGLKQNKIYYTNSTVVRAYRGVFRFINNIPSIAPRVRIVVDGEDMGELEVVDGELTAPVETRKFIRDGVLYIERDGVIYDAQGKRAN